MRWCKNRWYKSMHGNRVKLLRITDTRITGAKEYPDGEISPFHNPWNHSSEEIMNSGRKGPWKIIGEWNEEDSINS